MFNDVDRLFSLTVAMVTHRSIACCDYAVGRQAVQLVSR